jgi:hypothetical protein
MLSSGPLAKLVDAVDSKSTGRKAIPVQIRGGPLALVVACLALGACKSESAAPAAQAPVAPAKRVPDCREGHMTILADVMTCRMVPFSKGQLGEQEFRDTLAKIREVVPDPAWEAGDKGWPQIVDRMLQSHLYGAGCKECHKAYIEQYRRSYHDRPIGPL